MRPRDRPVGARLRIVLDCDVAIGPGRADLLQGIAETGSIAAAGRRMGMSYKRAWQLVGAMNAEFGRALVRASKGGPRGGGAQLTNLGEQVLKRYRRMETLTGLAIRNEIRSLHRLLHASSGGRRRA